MVTPFGVKTSDEVRASRADNERVDFFPVQWESHDEIVLGEDDRHLGSGLIGQSQKMTAAAMQMAEKKVWAHRS